MCEGGHIGRKCAIRARSAERLGLAVQCHNAGQGSAGQGTQVAQQGEQSVRLTNTITGWHKARLRLAIELRVRGGGNEEGRQRVMSYTREVDGPQHSTLSFSAQGNGKRDKDAGLTNNKLRQKTDDKMHQIGISPKPAPAASTNVSRV